MADRYPSTPSQLEIVMNEINNTFDNLIQQLNNRRHTLLDEIRALKEEMSSRVVQKKIQIDDLTAMQASIQVKLRHNEMKDAQERMLAEINQQLSRLDMTDEEYIVFETSGTKLQSEIASFGSIVKKKEIIPNYISMKQPIIDVKMKRNQPENNFQPRAIAFCETFKQIFIADSAGCIHIFSEDGLFIRRIEETLKCPWGIAIYKTNLYVTDNTLHAVILYRLPECTVVKTVTNFSLDLLKEKDGLVNPRGLTVANNSVYIADRYNNRIVVMDESLAYKHQILHSKISYPQDVKFYDDAIFILCFITDRRLQVFSLKGDYLYSLIARDQVYCYFFSIDIIGNIVMSGYNVINIFNKKGELINTIKMIETHTAEFYHPIKTDDFSSNYPTGVAITKFGKLITVSYNDCLQIYN